MCISEMCVRASVIVTLLLLTRTGANIEDHEINPNVVDSPSSVNFNDIFISHLSMLTDDRSKDKDFHLHDSQFVEFRFPKIETSTVASTSLPTTYHHVIKEKNKTKEITTPTTTVTVQHTTQPSTTKEILKNKMRVRKPAREHSQRGVLDLLFPSKRVKEFKHVFDSLRKILSRTFR